MPDQVNAEERRAYREGVVDQKLASHDAHFIEINGSIGKAAAALVDVEKAVSRLVDQVTGLTVSMPSIQKLATETATSAETAALVAEALARKTNEERTKWDRWRGIAAWGLGIAIAAITLANFTTRVFGVAVKAPPARTVTVQDITPGGP